MRTWGIVFVVLVIPAAIWGLIFLLIGGTSALDFFLKIALVLTIFSVIGAGVGWIAAKIGGSIND